ncbi:ABC-F family ATP-binding cassette domain-containing protein [Alkalihalophilus marmarensis]|uniref:Multidrug ABC transporter ATP-binding protein n=1 Tax=Alkalihalophilus marmarensis DSM 21297 TaxID=1188261 RepID=U6SKQ1_9BACI|nr:ABC-F family ATP-binding cassette domain-containing protein [Alkalihalophilus marmarensis]ERN51485.1 multidrug ABC transporter ATP-binding protein [Alkalihalophilus marmarensis DSM 21297]MCM3490302.1 ABC-F family ATP-binding cassette domain-containing protein [Alkalihalophilus marmarensis]
MSILQVEHLTKTYGDKTLFDDLSFTINQKERIGLIGINGTGKSTLLKVLAKIEGMDSGELIHANDFQIEYLPQQPELEAGLTVLEQIYYGDSPIMKTMRAYEEMVLELERDPANEKKLASLMKLQQKMDELDAWEANTTAKTILSKLGITDYTEKVDSLSGGQKKRVAIAKALIQPADLLLLDEPTNHLDHAVIEWLEGFLAQYRGAFIVITHDRYFLTRVTNKMIELDRGRLHTYEGNYEEYLSLKAEREEQEHTQERKRQNLLRRELAWLHRGAKARTTKQKARIQRVDELKEDTPEFLNREFDFAIGSTRLGKQVLEVKGLTKHFGDKQLITNLNYLIVKGERLGIVGPNGSGKTTLLQLLAGRVKPTSGEVLVGETVKIGYYTQEDEEIDGGLRVIDYIKEVAEVVHTVNHEVITAEQMLERFLFPRSMQYTYVRRLSGGEKRRLYLLKILMGEPNVLFLDEPTNDLDTQTLSVLEDYLDQFPGVVVTVSHDRYFLDRVVDHLLVFKGEGSIERFQGHYSDFLQSQEEDAALQKVKEKTEAPKVEKTKRKLSYHEQKEWDGIEEKIEKLEMKTAELEEAITKAGSDYGKISELMSEKEKVETELNHTMERWEELSILIEELQG